MKQTIHFSKASGAGNDFVLVNNMDGHLRGDPSRIAAAVCSRHFGIGADGLIVLEKSNHADFTMRYYNADGSYGGMCGNGGRCVARFAFLLGISSSQMTFEAFDHLYQAHVVGDNIRLQMKDPVNLKTDIAVAVSGKRYNTHFVDTGSPHVVLFVDDLESMDVSRIGQAIRYSPEFQPTGTNVNFVKVLDTSSIYIRTYERGVEAETLACGTGSVATAVVASHQRGIASPVKVRVRSGETLIVNFTRNGNQFSEVTLEGSAHMLFAGTMVYDDQEGRIQDSHVLVGSVQEAHAV